MCATYFGAIDEGDVVQLCGYAAVHSESADPSDRLLLFFAHESDGQVLYVTGAFLLPLLTGPANQAADILNHRVESRAALEVTASP